MLVYIVIMGMASERMPSFFALIRKIASGKVSFKSWFSPFSFTFAESLKGMKKVGLMLVFCVSFVLLTTDSLSQCSICTKTAQQLGEKTGRGLNAGIIYLAAAPMLIVGFIGYRWWKSNREP